MDVITPLGNQNTTKNWNRKIVILACLSIILGAFYLGMDIGNNANLPNKLGCPADKCQMFSFNAQGQLVDSNGQPVEQQKGKQDFGGIVPPGFPKDLPVDPSPIKILESSIRSRELKLPNNTMASSTEIVYIYITSQDSNNILNTTKKYLSDNQYALFDSTSEKKLQAVKLLKIQSYF